MSNLYIQTNILIAASWVVFQLLPKKRLSFRAIKVIAQTLLLSSLVAMPVLASLPEFSFPRMTSQIRPMNAQDVDSLGAMQFPVKQVLQQAVSVVESAPKNLSAWPSLWIWIFFAGMGAMLLRQLWMWNHLRHLLKSTLLLHKIGRTQVAISDVVAVPFSVWFLGRAYVVLPSELVSYREDFRIALRHEIEHHRRRDTIWAIVLEWLICGFYLNPAIYLWRKTILQLQELACDEALISRMRISKLAYGSCLLRVAEMALGRRFMYAGTTCMIPASESKGHSFLTRRIKMFAQHERSKAKMALALVFGTVSCLLILASAYIAQAAIRSNSVNLGTPVFDNRIQSLATEALKKGMSEHKASAGFAIVADPAKGTILAAVSINNGFDKNLKGDWALSYPIEPASALKPLVVASALQNYFVKIDDMHNCENGEYAIGGMVVHDSDKWSKLSTADTLAHSSNICTIKIGQMMGAKKLEEGLHDFGIGEKGDFPEASAGNLPKAGVIPDDNYIALVGQGVSNRTDFYVTPLEMVQAYSAIANGGRLMKSISADSKQTPEVIRAVLSLDASAKIRDALRKVVTNGTAQSIKASSIPLAGKTSTAVVNGNKRVTGFIGYAPADHPKLVAYVVMFDPKGKSQTGSTVAAPVFRDIAEKVLH